VQSRQSGFLQAEMAGAGAVTRHVELTGLLLGGGEWRFSLPGIDQFVMLTTFISIDARDIDYRHSRIQHRSR
jgi:hypothetical protein